MKMIKSEYKKLSSTHKIKTCTYNKLEKQKFSFWLSILEDLRWLMKTYHFCLIIILGWKSDSFIQEGKWDQILNIENRWFEKNANFWLLFKFGNLSKIVILSFTHTVLFEKIQFEFKTYENVRN